jgi:hypothetical protein
MKKKVLYSLLLIVTVFLTYVAYLINNPVSPLLTASYAEKNKDITVTYSAPFKNDRLIFGLESESPLVPFNKYWRTGANRHTMIKTSTDLIFADNVLNSGEYSMYTVPGENKWDITFNSTNAYFGISQPDSKKDLFTISVPSNKLDTTVEQFTIDFIPSPPGGPSSTAIRLRWDLTEIVIPFN